MPSVFPFRAVTYSGVKDLSNLVAPPYDVLDNAGKVRLLSKDPRNIVAIDLPHTPAKELGPPAAYSGAAAALTQLVERRTLTQADRPVMFAYRQTFTSADGKTYDRNGMCCCVETVPFGPRAGGGILPHEETFSGPKEDRMALTKATGTQLSPIFGLHADDKGLANKLLSRVMSGRAADQSAKTDDGTLHQLWLLTEGRDYDAIKAYRDALAGEDIFIADGHHRYTTGLNYLKGLESAATVPADHPARRCMMVLVGMSDPGLVIWPTHRVLGGMRSFSMKSFLNAAAGDISAEKISGGLTELDARLHAAPANAFGLYDFAEKTAYLARPASAAPLKTRFPDKPAAWQDLTVAFCQYVIVEKICQPVLNGGEPVKWAFPHTIREVEEIGSGVETGAGGGKNFAQLAVIVKPTPLAAVRDVSRANQLMPQKSTFFYPKLATGLFMNPLK
jgi:uncharacterized protein (DUF1015 family)